MTLGDKVKVLRKAKGLTQQELAQKLGIDPTYLSKVENNNKLATLGRDKIIRLAEILGADVDELVELAGKAKGIPPSIEEFLIGNVPVHAFLRKAKELGLGEKEWRVLERKIKELRIKAKRQS